MSSSLSIIPFGDKLRSPRGSFYMQSVPALYKIKFGKNWSIAASIFFFIKSKYCLSENYLVTCTYNFMPFLASKSAG